MTGVPPTRRGWITTGGAVLAVDQGTSGTKALVLCPERGLIGSATAPVCPRHLPGGLVGVDPSELYESVVVAGRRALAAAGEPVVAVGLANQGETALAWDPETGKPLTDPLVWQDRRAESVCAELAPHADELRSTTGLPLEPYFAAPKMAWIRRHLTRDGVVTTSDTWLVHRLTGAFVTDAAPRGVPNSSIWTGWSGRRPPWTSSGSRVSGCRRWWTRARTWAIPSGARADHGAVSGWWVTAR